MYRSFRIILVLAISATVLFASCSKGSGGETTGPITITATGIGQFTGSPDIPVMKLLQSKFGITINSEIATGADFEQKLAVRMSSGELSDLNNLGTADNTITAIKGNMLLALDDLVNDTNTPNVAQWKGALQIYRDRLSNGTGKLYALPTGMADNLDFKGRTHYGNYVVWEAFKKSGAKIPKNADELLQVFKAIQDAQPKSDDGRKAYAISLDPSLNNGVTVGVVGEGIGFNLGLSPRTTGNFLEYNANTKQHETIFSKDSLYVQGLKWYYKANQLGILDPESPTQTNATLVNKIRDGRVLTLWWWWAAEIRNPTPVVQKNPMQGFVPIFIKDSVMPDENHQNLIGGAGAGAGLRLSIGKNTKYAARIIKMLDFLYSNEGGYSNFGEEGDYWKLENGKAMFTQKALDDIKNGGKFLFNTTRFGRQLDQGQIDPRTGEAFDYPKWSSYQAQFTTALEKDWQSFMGAPDPYTYMTKNLKMVAYPLEIDFTSPAPDDIKAFIQQMGQIVTEDSWKAIYAKNETEFNSYIDDMIKKANASGIDKYIAWRTQDLANATEFIKKYNHK